MRRMLSVLHFKNLSPTLAPPSSLRYKNVRVRKRRGNLDSACEQQTRAAQKQIVRLMAHC